MSLLTWLCWLAVRRESPQVVVVDSMSHILSMFDRAIAEYATAKFQRDSIRLILQSLVIRVDPDGVHIRRQVDGQVQRLPAGMVVWATGVALHPLAAALAKTLSERPLRDESKGNMMDESLSESRQPPQTNRRSLVVDEHLRVLGSNGACFVCHFLQSH
jgi:NADH dehydrogenase FAD-containing subunit